MAVVHEHLLVRAWVEEPIVDLQEALYWVYDLVHIMGMKVLAPATGAYCPREDLRGVTVVVPIETSHVAIHIWDECRPALVELDVFSCKEVDPAAIMAHLSSMRPVRVETKFLDRAAGFADLPLERR